MSLQLDEIVGNARQAFELVHRKHFLGDPVANSRLVVDVLDPAVVIDTPTALLLTPWTINGLAFPPDDEFPEVLEIAGRRRMVFRVEMAELGPFRSVNLPLEAGSLRSMAQARGLTRSWTGHFQEAVRGARAPQVHQLPSEPGHPADPERLPRPAGPARSAHPQGG
jgi:[NiFe]-hydrogenase assembly, chaperone, HybE